MKRHSSTATLPSPPSKRLHTENHSTNLAAPPVTFESALYEELILLVFSHLAWIDLCTAQCVSQTWRRLAIDQSLWKAQYLDTFGRSRLRGAKGFIGRTDGREIRRPEPKDWRSMFKISFCWKTGRCTTEHIEGLLKPLSSSTPTSIPPHVLLAGSTTFIASSDESIGPEIHCLHSASGAPKQILRCGSSGHRNSFHITAMALDQSPPATSGVLRLAVFLSTGEFIIFAVHQSNPSATTRKLSYIPSRHAAPIRQAAYHHPLLVSLSEAFALSLYDLSSSDTVTHTQYTSYTTFPPSSLILSTQTPGSRYKLVLTYSVPVFPLHFSLGVTELIISRSHVSDSSLSSNPSSLAVISTRTTRALDVPQGWIDREKLRAMKDQWGRKLLHIQDTQSDGKWVVLAPGEPLLALSGAAAETGPSYTLSGGSPANLQLYRLFMPPLTSATSPPPKLTFMRYLHHTAGAVISMSIADGRCVTLGRAVVCIWDLESGTSAEVPLPPSISNDASGTIAFDDRRIITVRGSTILVHRFD
ncbi:hypothetical protein C8F01DRAFT_1205825 [Mycena amicta]|nr:hypothetical protein C8F01DRAFT_1205825 [Mycena amicta]